jgi:hypothetical protein
MSDAVAGWPAFALMGAYHGLNPAMGWLFAVALGFQHRSAGAVVRALPPLALGHAASIAVVVLLLSSAQAFLTPASVRYGSAALLLGFAACIVIRRTHLRWVGMRLDFKDLTIWSFLMSSVHGAGLMLVPVLLHDAAALASSSAGHAHGSALAQGRLGGFAAVAVHTLSMCIVMGVLALVVYRTVGLSLLRRAWINLDVVWAGALVIAGVATLVIA